jgi:DNA-binding phage protein
MKNVKTPTSRSYREYLISSLKDPQEAAAYIGTFCELEEGNLEPKLLLSSLQDVIVARIEMGHPSEVAKQQYEKLEKLLLATKGAEIYTLIELLDALGFRMAVALKD